MDWQTVTAVIGLVAAIANTLQFVEQSQSLRRLHVSPTALRLVFNLCVVAMLAIGIYKLGNLEDRLGRVLAPPPAPAITPENVEANVKTWLDGFRLSSQKATTNDPSILWTRLVTMQSGRRISIFQVKPFDRYITFSGALEVAAAPDALEKLRQDQKEQIIRDLLYEMAKARIGHQIYPPLRIVVEKRIPVSNNITEDSFIAALDEIDIAIGLAQQILLASYYRVTKPDSPQAPSRSAR